MLLQFWQNKLLWHISYNVVVSFATVHSLKIMNTTEMTENCIQWKLLLNIVNNHFFAFLKLRRQQFVCEVGKFVVFRCSVSSGCFIPKIIKISWFLSYSKNKAGVFWHTLYTLFQSIWYSLHVRAQLWAQYCQKNYLNFYLVDILLHNVHSV